MCVMQYCFITVSVHSAHGEWSAELFPGVLLTSLFVLCELALMKLPAACEYTNQIGSDCMGTHQKICFLFVFVIHVFVCQLVRLCVHPHTHPCTYLSKHLPVVVRLNTELPPERYWWGLEFPCVCVCLFVGSGRAMPNMKFSEVWWGEGGLPLH